MAVSEKSVEALYSRPGSCIQESPKFLRIQNDVQLVH
jgi:hypothetical protein